tara:strand:+ start:109 stop:444 length:336 start_codon:yes stop_codon:yes gene_type:complete
MPVGVLHIISQMELIAETQKMPNILFVVCFSASWCKPCKVVKPQLIKMCETHADRFYFEVDIENDDFGDLSEECNIGSLPTVQMYRNGEMLKMFKGVGELEDMCLFIENNS